MKNIQKQLYIWRKSESHHLCPKKGIGSEKKLEKTLNLLRLILGTETPYSTVNKTTTNNKSCKRGEI